LLFVVADIFFVSFLYTISRGWRITRSGIPYFEFRMMVGAVFILFIVLVLFALTFTELLWLAVSSVYLVLLPRFCSGIGHIIAGLMSKLAVLSSLTHSRRALLLSSKIVKKIVMLKRVRTVSVAFVVIAFLMNVLKMIFLWDLFQTVELVDADDYPSLVVPANISSTNSTNITASSPTLTELGFGYGWIPVCVTEGSQWLVMLALCCILAPKNNGTWLRKREDVEELNDTSFVFRGDREAQSTDNETRVEDDDTVWDKTNTIFVKFPATKPSNFGPMAVAYKVVEPPVQPKTTDQNNNSTTNDNDNEEEDSLAENDEEEKLL